MGEAQSSFKKLALRHFFLSKSLRFGQNKLFFFIYIQSPIRSGQKRLQYLATLLFKPARQQHVRFSFRKPDA
jgi:hypothetical protein